ncbi:hypothetical protein MMC18_000983 [Xylographa bjoerkii]|nr:hypothetical protein [Xylographa bjoerkii]
MSWKCCQGAAGAKAASDVACDCSTADIAFTAASSLSALASLPAISGEPTLVYSSSAAWKMSTETRQLFVSKSIQAWPTPPPSPASPQPTKPGTLLLQQRAPQPQTSSSPTLTLAYTADNTTAANAYASGVSRLTVDLAVGLSVGIAAVIAIVVAVLWWRRRHGHTISSSPGYMAKPSWQDTVSTSVGSGKGKEARRRVDSSPSRRGQVTELAEWTG